MRVKVLSQDESFYNINHVKIKNLHVKISILIIKGKTGLCQIAGIDPADITVFFTKDEIKKIWADIETCQRACANF